MMDPLRMLGANIRVAANLAHADVLSLRQARWITLESRAEAIGLKLVWDGDLIVFRDGREIWSPGIIVDDDDYGAALEFIEHAEASAAIVRQGRQ